MTHGEQSEVPLEALLSDDPDLELVRADAHEWSEAHPCECEGMCVCEEPATDKGIPGTGQDGC